MPAFAPRSRARALPRSVPTQLRAGVTAHARESRLGEHAAAARDQAKEARNGDAGKELRSRNPLSSGRGRKLPLRGADVGPALQQLPRIPERQRLGERRILPRSQIDLELARTHAVQHRDPVDAGRRRGTKGRHACFDRGHARGSAGHVLLFPDPGIPANRREAQRLPLIGETALRDRELLLQSPELEVVPCDLGGHAHSNVIECCRGAGGRRRCRTDGGPDPAEQVYLPECVEPGAVGGGLNPLLSESRYDLLPVIDGRAHGYRRIPIQRHIVEYRAGLSDARDGDLHVEIRLQGRGLQLIENRVLELPPPPGVVRLLHDEGWIRVHQRRRSRLGRPVRLLPGAGGQRKHRSQDHHANETNDHCSSKAALCGPLNT